MSTGEVKVDLSARQRTAALMAGLVLLAGGVYGTGDVWRTWLSLNDREPLLAGLPAGGARQSTEAPPRRVQRLVIVIADGVVADSGLALASVKRLARRGVRARATAPGPTFSAPSYAAWLSGVDPAGSGVRHNRYAGPLPLDSLLSRARAAGRLTMVYHDAKQPLMKNLFGPHIELYLSGETRWLTVLTAVAKAELSVVVLDSADEAGHHAGADSAEYRKALGVVDHRIGQIVASIDLERDLLVVVNDHGHLPGGGHGGLEAPVAQLFCVMAGAGVARGVDLGRIDQRDLAPLLAALAGLAPPAHNRGWPPRKAIAPDAPRPARRAAFAAQLVTRLRVERYLARMLGASLPAGHAIPRGRDLLAARLGNLERADALTRLLLARTSRAVNAAADASLASSRLENGLVSGGLWLALLVGAVLLARAELVTLDGRGVLVALIHAGAAYGGMRLLGASESLSSGGDLLGWLVRASGATALAALLSLFVGVALGGTPARRVGRFVVAALVLALLAAAGATLAPVVPGGVTLPDPSWIGARQLAQGWLGVFCLAAGPTVLLVARGQRR
ncbi:MAG: alkaline phosphatase family protein [Myxococcales bacterium]|nr:alkaline phosphatase family protein [Myxococcales bacterium]